MAHDSSKHDAGPVLVPESRPWRRPGAGLITLMVLFAPFVPLYFLARAGWRQGAELFRPGNSPVAPDPVLDRLQLARVVIGSVVVAGAFVYFRTDGLDAFGDQVGVKALQTIGIGLDALVLGNAGFALLTRRDKRGTLLRRVGAPTFTRSSRAS